MSDTEGQAVPPAEDEAVLACRMLVDAYLKGQASSDHIDWSDVNAAHEVARRVVDRHGGPNKYTVLITRVSRVVHQREVAVEAPDARTAEEIAYNLDDGDESEWREQERETHDYTCTEAGRFGAMAAELIDNRVRVRGLVHDPVAGPYKGSCAKSVDRHACDCGWRSEGSGHPCAFAYLEAASDAAEMHAEAREAEVAFVQGKYQVPRMMAEAMAEATDTPRRCEQYRDMTCPAECRGGPHCVIHHVAVGREEE